MRKMPDDSEVKGGAIFSSCQTYRYSLMRSTMPPSDKVSRFILWIMLNPSTADAVKFDPTVRRCWIRAWRNDYSTMHVANLFALRSRDPKELYRHHAPIGEENDGYIRTLASMAKLIVCAWGNHGAYLQRGQRVMDILRVEMRLTKKLRHLGLNNTGEPKHPLFVGFNTPLQKF